MNNSQAPSTASGNRHVFVFLVGAFVVLCGMLAAYMLFSRNSSAVNAEGGILICPKDKPRKSMVIYQFERHDGSQGPGNLVVCTKDAINSERMWRVVEDEVRASQGPVIDGKKTTLRYAVLLNVFPLTE